MLSFSTKFFEALDAVRRLSRNGPAVDVRDQSLVQFVLALKHGEPVRLVKLLIARCREAGFDESELGALASLVNDRAEDPKKLLASALQQSDQVDCLEPRDRLLGRMALLIDADFQSPTVLADLWSEMEDEGFSQEQLAQLAALVVTLRVDRLEASTMLAAAQPRRTKKKAACCASNPEKLGEVKSSVQQLPTTSPTNACCSGNACCDN